MNRAVAAPSTGARELVDLLERQGLQLWAEGDRLRYRGPADVLTPELRETLRRLKPDVLRVLAEPRAYPLSEQQQGLWFVYQDESANAAYNAAFSIRLQGALDAPTVERTFALLVARHPVLRTTYDLRAGEPVQLVHAHLGLDYWCASMPGASLAEIRQQANDDVALPFDLRAGPMLRVRLYCREPQEYVLLLAAPHIAVDGWSIWQLVDEFRQLYPQLLAGQGVGPEALAHVKAPAGLEPPARAEAPAGLEPPACRYVDYVQWQQQLLAGEAGVRLARFWEERIGTQWERLELPTDRPRPKDMRFAGDVVALELDRELTRRVREFLQAEGVTLFASLLAIYQLLLHRYTGQERIIVGSPTFGRTRPEFARVVGCFVNTLPLPATITPETTFRTLVRETRDTARAVLDHQDYPLSLLNRKLRSGDAGALSVFQADFVLQKPQRGGDITGLLSSSRERRTLEFAGLSASAFPVRQQAGQLDLTLELIDAADEIVGSFKYHTDLFERPTIERLARHFRTLAASALAQPDALVSELPLLEAEERSWLLEIGRGATVPLPDDTLADCVAAHVTATPSATAVVVPATAGERRVVSYGELWRQAELVGAAIRAAAQGRDGVVAYCLATSERLPATVLGAWQAGRAVVPLDPAQPRERLAQILEEAAPAVIVTEAAMRGTLPPLTLPTVLWEGIEPQPADLTPAASPVRSTPAARADDAAYVIFTSGSTGRPKGVVVTHRNLRNALLGWERDYELSPTDVHLQMAAPGFDVWMGDLARALGTGAALVLCPRDWLLEPALLAGLVNDERVSVAEFVPAVLRVLRDHLGRTGAKLDSIRLLACGSDQWYRREIEGFRSMLPPGCRLVNSYGVTEATIDSSFYELAAESTQDGDRQVPIGRPFPNVQLYVLDRRLEPVPIGVVGELCIAGEGVARGYLRPRPNDAERFVADPFNPNSRLYRTGDHARLRPDGTLELVGRGDGQVKIRGNRVELGDIEACLCEHPDVRAAVAVFERGRTESGGRLGAFVVPLDGREPDPACLQAFARERLPAYMVPGVICTIDRIPLNASGKVNRRALVLPADTGEQQRLRVAPRNAEEQAIAQFWAEVLHRPLPEIGVHDDFFELGGNSLNATQVAARVRDVLGVEFPLVRLFDHATIAATAEWVREQCGRRTSLPALRPGERLAQVPLSYSQERMWFLQQMAPQDTAYNMNSAIRIRGPLDVPRLLDSFRTVVQRHEVLRTRIGNERGRPYQQVHDEPDFLSFLEDLSSEPAEQRIERAGERLAEIFSQPYDLERDPLARLVVLRLDEQDHVLGTGMHHVAGDQWSFGVIGRELFTCYERGPEVLPPLEVQYADYAAWQRDWLGSGPLEQQLDYWRRQLAGVSALELPTDYARPAYMSFHGDMVYQLVAPELADGLRRISLEHRTTVFMTLLAGLNVLLHAHSRQLDIAVGVPIANRTQRAAEGLVGTFVNTLVHRNHLDGDPSFGELLQRVRATALAAYENQDVPFELLVKELQPARDTSHSPLFQVFFNLANATGTVRQPSGTALVVVPVPVRSAQFELSVGVLLHELASAITINYNTDLFSRETAERLLSHYTEILQRAMAEPQLRLSQLSEPASAELARMAAWQGRERPFQTASVAQLVAVQADRTPDRIAVESATGSWSYRELVTAAQRVTAELIELGVEPGDRVGILMQRGRELLAGLLGIVGAGAAYVPLDPGYPRARLEHMLGHSRASALVTHRGLQRALGAALPTLDLDHELRAAPVPFRSVDPEATAYVIYTSGSTGIPKGVAVPHRAVANFLQSMAREPGISAADTVLAITTISFDIAVLELYLPLTVGGRVVLVDEETVLDGRALGERIAAAGITLMQATPATWRLLIAAGWQGRSGLRALCGGEALPRALADQLLERGLELWNMYGPTETTVWSTLDRVSKDGPILIGRPIDNTSVHVLDERGRRVPIGVSGELYIGGAGVSTGYLFQPELTAERFVADPFRPGGKLYRTGDVVRLLADGRLEHLGRADHQVKIRGFRIELGEVEARLRAHPAVTDAAVTARDDRLTAYVISSNGRQPSTNELRKWLSETLPPYMLPSYYVPMAAFPLTPNGKIDRRQLPAPGAEAMAAEASPGAPLQPHEQLVAEAWARLLSVEQIRATDNFFELGGHSLLAMEAVALIEERTGRRIDPRSLFFRTLAEIAAAAAP